MPPNLQNLRWPAGAAGILLGAGLLSRNPLADGLTGESVPEVGLTFSPGYLVLAPLGGVLDHLSLLTDEQHVAMLVSLALVFTVWRVSAHLPRRAPTHLSGQGTPRRSFLRSVASELKVAGVAFVGLIGFYAFGVLAPRPMVGLQSDDADVVIVDFHSHTEASHDGRPGLDIRDRRAWHDAAGFDLVYVTDHATTAAVDAAILENPARAGEGISLLPGTEVRFEGQHVIVLGRADPVAGIPEGHPWPVLIQTIPNNLSRVPVGTADGRGGVQAIELLDADPRAFRQSIDERQHILTLVDSLDLAVVSGSNHHGWGRAAAGWNLVRLPGWQALSPEEVGSRIEALILGDRANAATRIVERSRLTAALPGDGPVESALMTMTVLPRFGWHVLSSLTLPERLVWLGWIALGTAVALVRAPRASRVPVQASSSPATAFTSIP